MNISFKQPQKIQLQSTQHGIFLGDFLNETPNLYLIAHCTEVSPQLKIKTFIQAIQKGINEADSVIANYGTHINDPILTLVEKRDIFVEVIYVSETPSKKWVLNYIQQQQRQCNLAKEEHLIQQILFVAQDKVYWYQQYHHIMLDGFSLDRLTIRIFQIYEQLNDGLDIEEENRFTSLIPVVNEYQEYVKSQAYIKDHDFWKDYTKHFPHPISLSDCLTPPTTTAKCIRHLVSIDATILQKIDDLAIQYATTRADLLMALSLLYLSKMTSQLDLVVGIPFMRRLGSKALKSALPTVNVLPVQFKIQSQNTWIDIAHSIKAELNKVRPHQRYDAEQISRDLKAIDIDQRLYSSILNYKGFNQNCICENEQTQTHYLSSGPVDDVEFSFINKNDQFLIELRADEARYTQQDLKEHGVRLSYLLDQVMTMPLAGYRNLSVTTPIEQKQIEHFSKGRKITSSQYQHILEIFFENAAQNPHRIALVSGTGETKQQLTFLSLSQKIHQFTQYLWQTGVQKHQVIAVAIPRSIDTVIAMLSILNSGATFLPIDLDYPIERIEMMCQDAQPTFILTTSALKEELPKSIPHIFLDIPETQQQISAQPNTSCYTPVQIASDDIAYVIFTSGSTGRPKGVMNTHGALLNLILAHQHTIFFPTLEKIKEQPLKASHTHSFSFDSSWEQIFWLIWGQELHIFDEAIRRDAYALVQELQTRKIDALDLPPSFCAQLIANGLFEKGKYQPSLILIGGEAAPLALWKQLKEQPKLSCYNLYGPTEYTVDTFYADLARTDQPVIGLPIANTSTCVLDSNFKKCPIGVVGELYISGHGLAAGYVGRADLTSTRFIANPFLNGKRMYRTGDLVRWNREGFLEFIGRSDDQIKIRGYRVEIGEVENAISVLDQVESTIVIAESIHQTHRLIAYCVVRDLQHKSFKEWSKYYLDQLRLCLPDYMVPSALIIMSEFPRNMSGKIDRKSLPKPFSNQKNQEPHTALEALIVNKIKNILQLNAIDLEDSFFAIGGDSISAIMLCTELRKCGYAVKPSDVFKYKTPRLIATYTTPIAAQPENNSLITPNINGSDPIKLPLLPLQKGMLFHSQLEDQKDDAGYQAYTKILFNGVLNVEKLQRALNHMLVRHPQLTGYFDSKGAQEPIFIYSMMPQQPWALEVYQKGFDVKIPKAILNEENGLIQAVLVQDFENQNSELIISIHHLITDGWSTPIFLRDLFHYYATINPQVLPFSAPYYQVIQQLIQQPDQQSKTFWQNDLKDCKSLILFKDQKAHQPVIESNYFLSEELTERLISQLKQTGITLNVYMQMIWSLWLSQYSHRNNVVFGTPVSGRSAPIEGLDEHIGLFLNTIPVHVQLNPYTDLWTQLQTLQTCHSERIEYDNLSLSDIQNLVKQAPLFDQLLVVENYPDASYTTMELPEVQVEKLINRGYSHYPLALLVIPHNNKIEFLLEQRDVIAQPETLLEQLAQWIEFSLSNSNEVLSRYPLITPQHQQKIQQINTTDHVVPMTTLQTLLRKSYHQYSHQVAIFNDEHTLTYQEVQQRVQTIASYLQHQYHIQPGNLIAVCLPRSIELSLTILAIIELGACYLPIDPTFPTDRINTILEDAFPACILTTLEHIDRFNTSNVVNFSDIKDCPYQPNTISQESPAYLIYTSGTTGKPKGVLVSHQAIVNRLMWMQEQYPIQHEDVILQKTPCTFDVSVWEFFWSYLVGAQLAVAPVSLHREPENLRDYIQKHRVTVIHFVPSMLSIFTSTINPHSLPLKYVFCSGEALPTHAVNAFKGVCNAHLYNLYGPTEAAIDVSYFNPDDNYVGQDHAIPIGFPVWNTQLYILDQYLRPVEIGIDGELYISGEQLAIGYLNRPDLNSTCFVANPFLDGQRMYKTGDIAHYNLDGSIQYVGRTDHQLKIRGQRIELGEIEAQIKACIEVEDVRVQAINLVSNNTHTDERQLVAYLQNKQDIEKTALLSLKKQLKNRLPSYMLPVAYVCLDKFPLSHNGKLDLKALPHPDLTSTTTQQYARTPIEQDVEEIFQDLLQIQRRIGVHEDFFSLGGHSILVMKMAIEMKKKFDVAISMQYLMSHANIEKLASAIRNQDLITQANQVGFTMTLTIREAKTPPIFCFSPGSGSAWQYSILNSHLHSDISIVGFQSPRPNGPLAISQSIDEVADHNLQQILKIQPQGPYLMLGYSLGGTVAFCVAKKLRDLGHEISFLGLFDTYPAEIHPWDEEVNQEDIEQEQIHFFDQVFEETDSTINAEKQALQDTIFANYDDAVRLLKKHQTQATDLYLNVFVAKKSLPDYVMPEENWRPYVHQIQIHELEEALHENILSPEQMTILGPLLNQKICDVLNIQVENQL